MGKSHYLTAKEAAARLKISLPTLYAYVSRGLIRSEAVEGNTRRRRYRLEDVKALQARKEWRHNPAKAAETALHFGSPVLESAITLIADGLFYYRGRNALALAARHTIEEVATLIWSGHMTAGMLFTGESTVDAARYHSIIPQPSELSMLETFQVVLPLAAADDPAAYDLTERAVAKTGVRILQLLTAVVAGWRPNAGMAQLLQQAWVPLDNTAAELLNMALILCADHELNVSSFTARCVASAGSSPYAVVTAALSALMGSKHGGHTERIAALFGEVAAPEEVRRVITGRLRRGEGIPGFGHPLYPEGDPRAQALLERVTELYPHRPAVELVHAIAREVESVIGLQPTLDFGLVALAWVLSLPPGAALTLFALGRSVGWIGHAIEQYQANQMIRPRARYVGALPEVSP